MPRPRKHKRVCSLPLNNEFLPKNVDNSSETIFMSIEEFECIRLIDLQGMDQNQCSEFMGVARSTIQRMYDSARKKVAQCLVEGKILKIQGGDYKICDGKDVCNDRKGRHRCGRNRS